MAFVGALDAETHCAGQIVGPMGGSLGGNLCLRLARRQEPWIRQSIAWSPASVWDYSYNDPDHGSYTPRYESFQSRLLLALVLLLLLSIQTGSDDLRGGSGPGDNCDVSIELASGGILSFPNVNAGHGWGNGQTHTVLLPLPEGTQVDDLARLSLRTAFGGGIGGDNWNVNDVTVTAVVSAAASAIPRPVLRDWVEASGNPLVRFTGSVHEWSADVAAPAADAGKIVLSLTLSIQTGSDDLRGGSHPGDNCDVVLTRSSAGPLTVSNVNVAAVTLRTQFGGGIGGDNWNVDHVILQALVTG